MEVVWSDMALAQLDEVIDYVEEHFGLLTSQNVLHEILEKTDDLAQYIPHMAYMMFATLRGYLARIWLYAICC